MENMKPLVWIIIAGVLLGLEMCTGTFYLLVIAVAAGMAALSAWLGAAFSSQLVLSVCMSLLGIGLVWRWHAKEALKNTGDNNNMEIGNSVVWKGENSSGSGWKVFYRGTLWDAAPAHDGVDPEQPLLIEGTNGNVLLLGNPVKDEKRS